MELRLATPSDVTALARLRWDWAGESRPPAESFELFSTRFAEHVCDVGLEAFLALDDDGSPVGMACLLRVPRPPDPDGQVRLGGDLQSVYVRPSLRGQGIGSLLVRAVLERAWELGMRKVTVQSGTRALPVYERLGFEVSTYLRQALAPS